MNHECFVSWFLSAKCNFHCTYCCIEPQSRTEKLKYHFMPAIEKLKSLKKFNKISIPLLFNNLEEVIENFKKQKRRFTFGFTGGEPFLYPDFVKICERLALEDEFSVAVDSNLSAPIDEFLDCIPPEKVFYFTAAPHVVERERMKSTDAFIKKAVLLLEKGYPVTFPYILTPDLVNRFKADYVQFKKHGLLLVPTPFRGIYNGRYYPDSYDNNALEIFEQYCREPAHLPASYSQQNCNAGMSIIRINKYGDVLRCMDDNTRYGNIYHGFKLADNPTPCGANLCSCYSPDSLFGNPEAWKNRGDLQRGLSF